MSATVPPPSTSPPPSSPAPPKDTNEIPLKDIQGDILSGFPKKTESWYFFKITDAAKFKKDLVHFIPLVKSTAQVLKDREAIDKHKRKAGHGPTGKPQLLPLVGVNISFSHAGLSKALGIDDSKIADQPFLSGQLADAQSLGDPGSDEGGVFDPDWVDEFKQEIHGVFIIAGDNHLSVDKKIREIEGIFGIGSKKDASAEEITTIVGDVRPGDQSAHEHFGYLDGVSNPLINGFDKIIPHGPAPIDPGFILLGQTGDTLAGDREPWMKNGSLLTFRYLFQKVPEFDDFVNRNAIKAPGLSQKEGADLLGARLVGRWKSGAPVDITPFLDDPEIGPDPFENNNFHFTAEQTFQKMCPFAAHIRKTNPRADLESRGISIAHNRILRRGIQFGPEVTKQERKVNKTIHGRGLLFACYSASITNGFRFMQESWANNPNFPFGTPAGQTPGFDPIIGQGPNRKLTGTDPNKPGAELILDDNWVVPKGGEYFFSPSISGLGIIASL